MVDGATVAPSTLGWWVGLEWRGCEGCGTVVVPLVAVFWVGWEAGCDGPAVETPLGWDCDTEAIVAMDLGWIDDGVKPQL